VLKVLPVAILAGGRATRMQPLTRHVPKSLLPVAGRPFIWHQLEMLHEQGVERVVMCIGHLGEQIQESVGHQPLPRLRVDYSSDGNQPLGTGGAVKKALQLLGERFFVLNGDSYLPCSLAHIQQAFRNSGRPALMTVLRNDDRWGASNVCFRDGKIVEYNKRLPRPDMTYIDFGLAVFSRAVFTPYAEDAPLDLAEICHELSRQGQLAGLEVAERFYEIGSPQGMREAEAFLTRRSSGA
jgi:N-acetyl-alpha-D-muramate 1-phosphate uridylyltransferase